MDRFATSEYKVTYLIGAGASAKALPMVKGEEGIAVKLIEFAENLKANSLIEPKFKIYVNLLAESLIWIAEGSKKFGTPDTFAKFLFLKEKSNLSKFKQALSFYFDFEQLINNRLDDRVLPFFTSIMNTTIFPSNVKILSWNYDCQFQLNSEVFGSEKFDFLPGGATGHTPPFITYYPSIGKEFHVNHDSADMNEYTMVHLNGVAGYYMQEKVQYIFNDFINQKPISINELIKSYFSFDSKNYLISFAWEHNTEFDYYIRKRVEIAKQIIKDSDVLVVIGYSFPFFNRNIDKQIFSSLKERGKLKKIYFQDPNLDGSFLRKQFDLSEEIEIIHIKDVSNYYVPNEL